jgi:hypothetical protein
MEGSVTKKKKQSSLPKLAGLLVFLALVAFAIADPLHLLHPTAEKLAEKDPERRVLIDAKKDDITAFEIKPLDGEAFRIQKDKDHWFVTVGGKRSKADMERVDKMLEELPELRSDSLVTEDAKQYDTMEVSEGRAIVLKVYKGGVTPLVTLHVGKAAPGFQSSFVRVDAGKQVWNAATNVKSLVGFSAQDYRTKKPWSFKTEAATKLTLTRFVAPNEDPKTHSMSPPATGPELSFELKDGLWKQSGSGSNGNQNVIKEFLKSFADLQESEYVDTPDAALTKLAGRTPSITVESPEGKFVLIIGARDASYWYVSDQDGVTYKISDYLLNFYKELDWDKLTFDDSPKVQPKKDEKAEDKKEGK